MEDNVIMWDKTILTDRTILANRPDLIILNKNEQNCLIVDVAVHKLADTRQMQDTTPNMLATKLTKQWTYQHMDMDDVDRKELPGKGQQRKPASILHATLVLCYLEKFKREA